MLPRERVIAALEGRPTDRAPHHFRAWGNVLDLVAEHFRLPDHEAVLEWAGSDFRDLGGLSSYLRPGVRLPPGTDIWGVRREVRTGEHGSYSHVCHSPLADADGVDDARAYRFPDAAALFDFSDLAERARRVGRDGRYFLWTEVESVFDRTMLLRGMEQFLVDLVEAPDLAHYLLGENARFFYERTAALLRAARGAVDCVLVCNDFGTQHGLLISPAMYREFVKPHQERLFAMVHEHGARVMYHSCGRVAALYPDLLEIGADIIDPLQFTALELSPEELRARYPAANLHGGLDTQHVLPFGTPGEVAAEVRRLVGILGREGRYIFSTSHNIQGGVPVANLAAMAEAAQGAR